MKKSDILIIIFSIVLSVFWIALPILGFGRTGEGLGYDIGSQSGPVIMIGVPYLVYRIYQYRKHRVKIRI